MIHTQEKTDHLPVMLDDVLAHLDPKEGEVHVDGTFGYGGYTSAILDTAKCNVIAIDRDETVLARADALKEKYGERLKLVHGVFGEVADHLAALGIESVDGFVLDIGVSSMQIDEAARGFSFQKDGPLDMRMGRQSDVTAASLIAELSEEDLANLIYKYGEERFSRRIASAILKAREEEPIETTLRLAAIVRDAVPGARGKIHPATKTFQALRIAVNDELGELERALNAALMILKEGGRLVVVTFHSLEDRIVKMFMKEHGGKRVHVSKYAGRGNAESSISDNANENKPFQIVTTKAVKASKEEASRNPRARSAKLRCAQRVGAVL